VAPRPPEFKKHRVAVYVAYGVVCAIVFAQLIRSVFGDLYGRPASTDPRPATPQLCLDEVERLAQQLAARAALPATGAPHLEQRAGEPDQEWDRWARRWETEVAAISSRCQLSASDSPALQDLAAALESLEDLRRELARSGEQTAATARKAREALAAARSKIAGR
jgi:hypothetical protein